MTKRQGFSKTGYQLHIDEPARQVTGHRKKTVFHIPDPKVGNGVIHLKQVEYLCRNPHIVEMPQGVTFGEACVFADELFGEAYVDPSVVGHAQGVALTLISRRAPR